MPTRIADHTLNRLTVLKAIRRSGPVSRSQLPQLTELSGGTITQVTSELLERGLISERREAAKQAGRPRVALQIKSDGAIVVGASLAGRGILTVAFVDLVGDRQFAIDVRIGPQSTLGKLATNIAAGLKEAIAASPYSRGQISRVGIALPAVIDNVRGIVHFMVTFPVGPVPFAETIGRVLRLPVTIENDLVCMARFEHWFGRAQNCNSFAIFHVGYSVGLAEYADGLPRFGAHGLSPEFGHVKIAHGPDARLCYCGARGCLTAYTSMYGMLVQAELLGDAPFPAIETLDERFEKLLVAARKGDRRTLTIIDEAGVYLGVAIANYLNARDPGTLLMTFANPGFMPLIESRFHAVLRENTLPGILPVTKLLFAPANDDWRWKGTAALALEQTYLGSR